VLVASIVAWPIAYFAMRRWLDAFAYRIELSAGVFVAGALAALLVAVVTVGTVAARAAARNPTRSLRYE
jgi:putative ABC transport system permease protein